MKNDKDPNRITSELLETAFALRKHNVLSAEELSQVKVKTINPAEHHHRSFVNRLNPLMPDKAK